jgi:hypothetical protein
VGTHGIETGKRLSSDNKIHPRQKGLMHLSAYDEVCQSNLQLALMPCPLGGPGGQPNREAPDSTKRGTADSWVKKIAYLYLEIRIQTLGLKRCSKSLSLLFLASKQKLAIPELLAKWPFIFPGGLSRRVPQVHLRVKSRS